MVLLAALVFAPVLEAQMPAVRINQTKNLELFGHVNHFYQVDSSIDLRDWSPFGTPIKALAVPLVRSVAEPDVLTKFFRVRPLASAENSTAITACAEEDNVNVSLWGYVSGYRIEATHPGYAVTDYNSPANFTNCTSTGGENDYTFTPLADKLFDNGIDVHWAYRSGKFWRPHGMRTSVNGGNLRTDIHYLVLSRKIADQNSWPGFLVLYSDGNMRLIPFPPSAGVSSVQFGSSVIVGPADPAFRPLAEIESADYLSASRKLNIVYRSGGSSTISVTTLDRTHAVVDVRVNHPSAMPFCTLRSMYVAETNCDTAIVEWKELSGAIQNDSIMSFAGTVGSDWLFKRATPSAHNNSAPDLRITPYWD